MHILIVGGSGGVGRHIVERGTARGHRFRVQTRSAERVTARPGVEPITGAPDDRALYTAHLPGIDGVVFALGIDSTGPTTLFSDATRALIPAMEACGVRRLVAITGIGAGETRGHGGFLYDWFIFPLFTRARYADKERQEALIAASGLDWTIVRPAPFNEGAAKAPFEVLTALPPPHALTRIRRIEVADFVLETLEQGSCIRQKPFIGHRR